jgi:hypothetical protein
MLVTNVKATKSHSIEQQAKVLWMEEEAIENSNISIKLLKMTQFMML